MKAIKVTQNALWALMLITMALFSSCNEPDIIGLEVLPANDKLNISYNDTFPVIAYSIKEDSIRSDKTVLNLLGNYNDPVFGRTAAGFYTQIRLSSNNVDFGTSPVADSLVLTLAYKGYYGKLRKLNIKVFELLEDIYKDSTYYSNKVLNTDNQPLADLSLIPAPGDSVVVDTQKYAPHLRIKLSMGLAQKFLNESLSANMNDNEHFLPFFKGLYVTTTFVNSEGAILYFDLMNVLSQVTLYYKNDSNDSLKYNFVINDNCARFNAFNHYNYTNANPSLQQQINGDTLLGDSLLYLQSMSGLKVKLKFPNFKAYCENNKIVLNKAELIIPVETDDSQSKYPLPEKLTLVRLNETGQIAYLIDQYEGETYFKGIYDETINGYSFTITRHLQNIILNNIQDYGLYLMVSGSGINAGRALLRGTRRSDNNFKLKITYTKL